MEYWILMESMMQSLMESECLNLVLVLVMQKRSFLGLLRSSRVLG